VTSDYYSILGVTPGAEDVVIRAAYRALMRYYHPDTNPDPEAQARAQEITAAYAVLRDPAKRAEYDASQAAERDFWSAADELPERPPPPAMRGVGMASAALALVLVTAVWALPRNDPPARPATRPPTARAEPPKPAPEPTYPVVQLEPESERLARLHEQSGIRPPVQVPEEILPEPAVPIDPVLAQPRVARTARLAPVRAPGRRQAIAVASPPAATLPAAAAPPAAKPKAAPQTDRIAALDRMSSGFFTQSMRTATGAKKDLLVAARDRAAAQRKACQSEACVADSYVRQIRETSAIVEARKGPPK